jgi:uncharacterized protein with HEPN domain
VSDQPERGSEPEPGERVGQAYGRRVRDTLLDLLEFTDMAARLVARGRPAYDGDEALRLAAEAITHRIGEAVSRLTEEFVTDHPQIEWRKVKGMRNIVTHEYARIDYEILWNALALRVPEIAAFVRGVLAAPPQSA